MKASGRRERADRQVPAAVGGHERAAVELLTVAVRPGQRPRRRRARWRRRREQASCAYGRPPQQEQERQREQASPGARAWRTPSTRARSEIAATALGRREQHEPGTEQQQGRQHLGHDERRVGDEPGVQSDQRRRQLGATWRREVPSRADARRPRRRPRSSAFSTGATSSVGPISAVEQRQDEAVADRVVDPRPPHHVPVDERVLRVAEPGGEALGAEVIVVTVPHGLAAPRDRHVQARQERDQRDDQRVDVVLPVEPTGGRPLAQDAVSPPLEAARKSRNRRT